MNAPATTGRIARSSTIWRWKRAAPLKDRDSGRAETRDGRRRLSVLTIQSVADDPAAGRASAACVAHLLQSRAAASSLSHARKTRTFADSRRFFGQTKQ